MPTEPSSGVLVLVALTRGAWIETLPVSPTTFSCRVVPTRGAWIEISAVAVIPPLTLSPYGSVD